MRPHLSNSLAILLLSSCLHAASLYVPNDYPAVQAAIVAAEQGDTVIVRPGLYIENINLLGKRLVVISESGPVLTVLEPASTIVPIVSLVSGEDSNTVIDGFTIRNNTSNWGVRITSSGGILRNCDIYNCSYSGQGGGVACTNSFAKIRNNRIHGNYAGNSGGGIGITGHATERLEITGNLIYENETLNHGPGISCLNGSNILIARNVLFGNSGNGQYAGAIYIWGSGTHIINNTIVNNTRGISMAVTGGEPCLIYNNLVAGNDVYGIAPGSAFVDYNDDWNNGSSGIPGPNGISADPQFVNPLQNDYHLNPTSPCINAGHPDLNYNDPDGTRNDIGALPILSLAYPLPVNFLPDVGAVNGVVTATLPEFSWEYLDTGVSIQTGYEIEVGTDGDWGVAEMWQSGQVQSGASSAVYGGAVLSDHVRYYIRIRLFNDRGPGSWQQSTMITRYSSTIHVPDGFATIADGLAAALDGDTVKVGAGTYSGTGNRDLDFAGKAISLIGAGSDSTIIDCQGTPTELHRAFWLHSDEDTLTMIKDIRITNGVHQVGGAIYCVNAGLRVDKVVFQSNKGSNDYSSGGAIAMSGGNATFHDCWFEGNQVWDFGGAVDMFSARAKFNRCTFTNNRQTSSIGCVDVESGGGAVYGYQSILEFVECTFEKNYSVCGVNDIDAVWNCSLYVDRSSFIGRKPAKHSFWGGGDVKAYYGTVALVENSLFTRNDGYPVGGFGAKLTLNGCTIVDCYGAVFDGFVDLTINNCLISENGPGKTIYIDGVGYNDPPILTCTNMWNNAGGDWSDTLSIQLGQNGNVRVKPFFCDPISGDYRLGDESFCLPDNNPCGELIGAFADGCSTVYICGDADASSSVSIADAVYLINYIFAGGPTPNPLVAGDSDCSGSTSIADAVYIINYIFAGGTAPCAGCP